MRLVPPRLTSVTLSLAVVPAIVALPVMTDPTARPHPVSPVVRTVALGPATLSPVVDGHVRLVGASWDRGTLRPGTRVEVRVRTDGDWTAWTQLKPTDMGPDAGTVDARGARGRVASEPVWVGTADGVQTRVARADGMRAVAPRALRFVLVDPGRSDADDELDSAVPASAAYAAADRPRIHTRDEWGADESLRKRQCGSDVDYSDTVKVGFVHHTDTSNSYSRSEVPAIIRSVYAYHVKGNGWCDVGYNFLVDKFGRIWEGRWGGVTKPVVGAHTGGFNTDSFGAAALGDYTTREPTKDMVQAYQRLFAWKLGLHYRDPLGTDRLVSSGGGTSKYPAGDSVRFNVVSGHRNAGATSCPGDALYAKLNRIRTRASEILGASFLAPSVSPTTDEDLGRGSFAVRAGVTEPMPWTLTVTNKTTAAVVKRVKGTADPSRPVATGWNRRDARGVPVPKGSYLLSLTGGTSDSEARPFSRTVTVTKVAPVRAVADVFGSGNSDLVVGVPGRAVGGDAAAGAVVVQRGGVGGLQATGAVVVSQASRGTPGGAEPSDRFGTAVSTGDFNGDGFAEVAAGVPNEDVAGVSNVGTVLVFPSGPDGPRTADAVAIGQDTPGIAGSAEAGDRFGAVLAAGDVDRDGFDDLVVGVPDEDVGAATDAGMVTVVPGSASGLAPRRSTTVNQSTLGVPGGASADDGFGASLAVGDATGDGYADVAVAAPGEGVVVLVRGSTTGVVDGAATRVTGAQTGNVPNFGRALALGRFNGATSALVVGGGTGVTVVPAGSAGLAAAGAVTWTEDTPGVPGVSEAGDDFGAALAAADVDKDGYDDLAVGAPREDVGSVIDAGAVTLLRGSAAGLTSRGAQSVHQDAPAVPGAVEEDDRFGAVLALLHLNGGTYADLVVATPREDGATTLDSGAATWFLGGAAGLPADADRVASTTIARGTSLTAAAADQFGAGVAGR